MTVTASIVGFLEGSVVVLTVDYPNKSTFSRESASNRALSDELGRRLREEYKSCAEAGAPCVIELIPDVAGSGVVRAILEAYKEVTQNKGALFVQGYPHEYLAAMTAVGMTTLPHFHLANSVAGAVERARRGR